MFLRAPSALTRKPLIMLSIEPPPSLACFITCSKVSATISASLYSNAYLDVLAEKYPQAFFGGMVAMSKIVHWDTTTDDTRFGRTMTPDEIMDKLEERVGPKGRRLFENFLRKVNKLQAEQQLEARSQIEGGESPPGSSSK
jgi:hypothetical protein